MYDYDSVILYCIEKLRQLNCPTEGITTYELWTLLSSDKIPMQKARDYYIMAGYKPFMGYPLTRLEK